MFGVKPGSSTVRTPIPTQRTGSMRPEGNIKGGSDDAPVPSVAPEVARTPAAQETVSGSRTRAVAAEGSVRAALDAAQQKLDASKTAFNGTVKDAAADGNISDTEREQITDAGNTVRLDSKQVELGEARVRLDDLTTAAAGSPQSGLQQMELRAQQDKVSSLEQDVRNLGGTLPDAAPAETNSAPPATNTKPGGLLPAFSVLLGDALFHGDFAKLSAVSWPSKFNDARPPRSPQRPGGTSIAV